MSRFFIRKGQQLTALLSYQSQTFSTTITEYKKPIRPEYPAPVRYGFVPEEWFSFLYPKTGVTGPYIFTVGVSTYLVSKEIYVLDHEYYQILPTAVLYIYIAKKYGHVIAKFIDKKIDDYENGFEESRNNHIKLYQELIEHEKKEQWRTEGQKMIMDIKKVNVHMQLEAAYRERLSSIYQEVKKRLDYQVQLQKMERKLSQKYMVQWIVQNVTKAFTPEQEKIVLTKCINDLQSLIR